MVAGEEDSIVNQCIEYQGYGPNMAHCHVRIQEHGGAKVVIMTEAEDNPGTSIVNAAEEIAGLICGTHRLDPLETRWIQRFQLKSGNGWLIQEVEFMARTVGGQTVFTEPVWMRIDGEEDQKLLDLVAAS